MILPIRFSPRAEETYDSVIAQLNSRWGATFVDQFEKKVVSTINLIATSPSLYPSTDFGADVRRCVLHKNCSMFYRINNTHITILYFWDNRQDPITF